MARRRIKSLNWLRVFEVAAQTESFSAASRVLNMSPSAISQQILALETQLGAQLFLRLPRSVKLTRDGHAFLPTVRQALGSVDRMAEEIFGTDAPRDLRLQANTVFATCWLAPRLAEFQTVHPEVELSLVCADRMVDFRDAAADLFISYGPIGRGASTEVLFSETVYPVATPEVAKRIDRAGDFAAETLISVLEQNFGWEEFFAVSGRPPSGSDSRLKVSNTTLALMIAACGNGVALARSPVTDGSIGALGLVPCETFGPVSGVESYYLTTQPDRDPSPQAAAFSAWLLHQAHSPSG